MEQGLIHIYCGDGKGKTTAAVGLAVRAWGRGKRVVFTQFLKSKDSGERHALARLEGLVMTDCPDHIKFTFAMSPEEREQAQRDSRELLTKAFAQAKEADLLILDEFFGALATGMLDQEQALSYLKGKPESLEVVLTGRDPAPAFLSIADYVSDVRKQKHPFDNGISARLGIEY